MDTWIELQDGYLTNQPTMYAGRGKARIPNPNEPPTEAWLFVYHCKRTKRGVKRVRSLECITAVTADELDQKIANFSARKDVIVIRTQERPLEYAKYRGEPEPIDVSDSTAATPKPSDSAASEASEQVNKTSVP